MEATEQEQEQIADALYRAADSTVAADNAIKANDDRNSVPLLFEAMTMTLEALAMCARKGTIEPLVHLVPSVVYFVKAIQCIKAGEMERVKFIRIGSSIGFEEESTQDVFAGRDGLRRELVTLEDGNKMELCFNPRTKTFLTMVTCKHCNSTFSSDWDKSVAHSSSEALLSLAGHRTRCEVRQ